MKQIHMIKDNGSGLFFHKREDDKAPTPTVPRWSGERFEPDLFSEDAAALAAEDFYGPGYESKCKIIEATATEYMKFIGRQGGSKSSNKKTRACRLNARNKRVRA